MIKYVEKKLSVEEYLSLRNAVGWKPLTNRQAGLAVTNSLYMVGVYDDEKLIGMGRIVGDGGVICYIQDLIILPEYRKRGIGFVLIKYLKDYVESLTMEGEEMMLDLMCAKGRENFYIENGFIERPNEKLGPGMISYIKKYS